MPFCFLRKMTARTISEDFTAIPINELKIIQKTAPAPPIEIAAATPVILPVPTVAASELQIAPKDDDFCFFSFPEKRENFSALKKFLNWKPFVFIVNKIPAKVKNINGKIPEIKFSNFKMFSRIAMFSPLNLLIFVFKNIYDSG